MGLNADGRLTRRGFLRSSAAAAALVAGGGFVGCARPRQGAILPAVRPMERVRMGFVGVGSMGSNHVRNFLSIPGVEVRAICDIKPEHAEWAAKWVVEAGQARPELYTRGERDFVRLCDRGDLDLVFTATPWRWHVPVCVAAMERGKHAATEVPAATSVEDCWRLVETAGRTGRQCVMMENCCYDRVELLTLNLVRQGVLGEVLHAEGGYLHDLRAVKFKVPGEGEWRRRHSIERNGDVYPTHGLGPVAQCMNVNRGNRFTTLVSMASPSRGLHEYAAERFGPESPEGRERYALGDVVTTLIQTEAGQTITITHDTNLPRPYSRAILVQGTKGIIRKYPTPMIHVEGRSPGHGWEELAGYYEQYEHPLWKALSQRGEGRGHGGMDFIEDYRLIECLRTGAALDMDVYDAAAWSAVTELSERSIARGSEPVEFPDFTRGAWREREPLGIVTPTILQA